MKRFAISTSVLALLVACALIAPAGSQAGTPLDPPPNDDFANAQVLDGSVFQFSDDNILADKEPGEPNHAGRSGGTSIWYRWTAPETGLATVSASGTDLNSESLDTLLGIYTGTQVNALTEVASNDDFGDGPGSRVSFPVIGGQAYRIAIDGFAGAQGNTALSIFLATAENDDFDSPAVLGGTQGARTGDTNVGATKQPGEPDHAENVGGASVWYEWTPQEDEAVRFTTEGSDFDTLLGVYTGSSLGDLDELVSNDDTPDSQGSRQSTVKFNATAGETYRIAVDGLADPEAATGRIEISYDPVPPPKTKITKKPKKLIKVARQARVSFGFTSTDPFGFQCKLDKGPVEPCASPEKYAVKATKKPKLHRFEVTGYDALGNEDPTPAVATFKVVKKKKRR